MQQSGPTILDKTNPKEKREALANWKKRVGEQKAQEIVTEASGRGNSMHKYLEDYILNSELPKQKPILINKVEKWHKKLLIMDCVMLMNIGV